MSQSGYTPIQLYRTTTASAIPTAGNLSAGELAINLTDERLYFKNAAGVVKLLASNTGALGTVTSVAASGGTTGLTFSGSPITSSGTLTLGGTLGVANGGTGTGTAFTAGSVVFAGASGVYSQDNANLFWDDTNNNLGVGTATPTTILQASYSSSSSGIAIAGTLPTLALYDSNGTTGTGYLAQFNTDTFLYNKEAGALAFGTNNTERARINSSGTLRLVSAPTGNSLAFDTSGVERARVGIDASNGLGFAVGSTTPSVTITSAGDVGIGTTAPAGKLNVVGAVTVTNGTVDMSDGYPIRWGGAASGIYSGSGTSDMVFLTGSSSRMWINGATGDVGIGTNAPGAKLDVSGGNIRSLNTTAASQIIASNTGGILTLARDSSTGGSYGLAYSSNLYSDGAYPLRIWTNNAERMRIDSAGDVGIGTTAPEKLLSVSNAGANGFEIEPREGNFSRLISYNRSTSAYTPVYLEGLDLRFFTGSGSEAMRIDSSGNVGIGTTNPVFKLQVAFDNNDTDAGQFVVTGSTNVNKRLSLGFNTTGNYGFVQALIAGDNYYPLAFQPNGGNVGIGTTSPGAKLHVGGTGELRLTNSANSSGLDIGFWGGTGDASAYVYQRANSSMFFGTNNTARMTITGAGNVGIGTTSPAAAFQLAVGQAVFSGGDLTNLGIQVKVAPLAAIPSAQVQGYIATGDSSIGVAGDLFIAPRTDVAANIRFITGTTPAERMLIDGSGNVGINVTPSAWGSYKGLQINDGGLFDISNNQTIVSKNAFYNGTNWIYINSNFASFYQQFQGQHRWHTAPVGAAGNTVTFTQAMTLDSSGYLLINRTSRAAGIAAIRVENEGRYGSHLSGFSSYSFGASGSSFTISDYSNGSTEEERMRIDNNGNLLVGTTSPSETSVPGIKLVPADAGADTPKIRIVTSASTSGTAALAIYSTGAAAYRFYVDNAGNIFATNTSISAISDIRLKENVRELDAGLDTILALKPRRFDWKQGKGKDVRDDMGFIAQEVEEVLPELIGGWKAGEGEPDDLKSVKAGDLIPVLVKAIQELTARVAQLEERK
jgi:hypothetical protein